jgi:CheY-like chemotaxis protein
MKILVADDEPTFRETMRAILSQWPEHHVTIVEDGDAAWTMLNDTGRSFDLAFLDVSMPGQGGLDLLQRLRESPFYRSIQVVICTAANDRATIAKAIQLGSRHYLVKPCTEAVIADKLRQLGAVLAAPMH